jgi:adenosylcobyric acid synthase
MLQGVGSHVGKSLLVAGLARAYARRGVIVRPFKPQNMSNNAAVTADGGEIGRAQALQARACGVSPSADMNPVLLKPQSEIGAQIVVQGRAVASASAREYHALKPRLLPKVLESFGRLCHGADLILVEGAGSPAEVNLRDGDIANMGFAVAAQVPVALVADVDRGGAISAIVGTWELLEVRERALLKGYIVNKFRGDDRLFDGAIEVLSSRTGLQSLGIIPFLATAARLPAEDAVSLDNFQAPGAHGRAIKIVVPRLARMANFDDLDPLAAEPDVALDLVEPGRALPGDADLVLLPGSKSTLADLALLREQGWDIDLAAHRRRGGWVLGLCGGYQILGERIADPEGIDGTPGEATGLGMLEIRTELTPDKRLAAVSGTCALGGVPIHGYEMHVGVTEGADRDRPMFDLGGRGEGARSADGRVQGTYLHGMFAADEYRHDFLNRLTSRGKSGIVYEREVDDALDALADVVGKHLDLDQLLEFASGA